MLKESQYNHYLFENDYAVIFNSYTKRIVKTSNVFELKSILLDINNEINAKSKLFQNLTKDNFFIQNDVDESYLGKLLFMDKIYEKMLSITILASEQCNFRCKYCYEDFNRGNIKDEVIINFLKYFSKNISYYNNVYIDWFGGEPLLAVSSIEKISSEIINICHKKRKPYYSSMTTNGYLLNLDTFRRMLKSRVSNFQITIDGIEDIHNKTRVLQDGSPTFTTIINNLRSIRDNIVSSTFSIIIRTNITKNLLGSMEEYLKFLSDEFGNDNRFRFYFRPTGNWGGKIDKNIESQFIKSFDELYLPILHSNYNINIDAYSSLLFDRICNAAYRNSFIIGSDGTIYKCTMLFNEEYNKIGRLTSDGNLNIDKSKLAKWVMAEPELSTKCRECSDLSICNNRNCAARFFNKENCKIESCGYEKKSIDYVLKLLNKSNSKLINSYD